jgi:hypothetical protein
MVLSAIGYIIKNKKLFFFLRTDYSKYFSIQFIHESTYTRVYTVCTSFENLNYINSKLNHS